MIPLQLTLRNFLSYREAAELDLSGVHLACISGLNGAGKSSLLDAITWALFGKSRVKSDDDIVNRTIIEHGAAAEVSFVFELEGAVYRIIRRKAAGRSMELEFHARTAHDGVERWQVMTEAKIRETQAEIEKLLRMNYEVFTNASFLLQGKADEFTTKTPDKRKEILAEILGVSRWEDYKEIATERRKGTDNEVSVVDRRLAEIDTELAQEEELKRELDLLEAKATAATAERDRQEALVTVARQNKVMADQQRDALRRLASELVHSERELQQIEGTVAQRQGELAAQRSLIDRREAITAAYVLWTAAETEFVDLQARAEQHNAVARQMHPLEMAIARLESQLNQQLKELEARGERAAKASSELEAIQGTLRQQDAQLAEIGTRVTVLSEQQQAHQAAQAELKQIEFERRLLAQELTQLEARYREIEGWQAEQSQIAASRLAAEKLLADTVLVIDKLAAQQQEHSQKIAERKSRTEEQDRLKEEMNELEAKIAQFKSEVGHNCPLCGQILTDDHRQKVLQSYQAEGVARGDQFRRNKAALAELGQEIPALEKALQNQPVVEKTRETQQATLVRLDTRLQNIQDSLAAWRDGSEAARVNEIKNQLADETAIRELTARLEQYNQAASETRRLSGEQKQLELAIAQMEARSQELERVRREWEANGRAARDETRERLAAKTYALDERASLAELAAHLAAIGYSEAALAAARARRDEYAGAPQDQQKLLQAEAAVKPLADGLADLEEQRRRTVARVADLRTQQELATRLLDELAAGAGDLPAAEEMLRQLREDVIVATRAVGGARQRVEVLAVRREDRRELTAQKTALARRVGLLRQLEEACGRKGVQAMLIDAALPDIQNHANDLLDRLTGGDMRVSIETQKASKTKQDSLIETLDIKIRDSDGERPYENYSGGEKFRINFAIRLALSQVLAHRAGARLQTLVIDEGFGSQDPEGRQRLVEAINAVQDKFACILVITHIDELRDKFPARIDVEKTAAGSRVSLVTI